MFFERMPLQPIMKNGSFAAARHAEEDLQDMLLAPNSDGLHLIASLLLVDA